MNATAEQTIMSHKLTPARQNEIFSRCQWSPDGSRVRVSSTHRTDPLLRAAGVSHPRPLQTYLVKVRRDTSGFLVIDHDNHPPQSESDDADLFAPGGLFAGESPNPGAGAFPVQIPIGFFEELRETVRIRRFEILTTERTRIRVEVLAYEDLSLPSPCEPEQWRSREVTDTEIHAAVSVLHMAREISRFER
jgi:hypothetical protein